VINNLISNALKYAPGGEVTIKGRIEYDHIVCSVEDHGPGISPGDAQQVFDRFYRAPEMARHTKGAGLGLYLTRQIIEAHGGQIWVDKAYDDGARFCFSLPLDTETE